LSSISSISHNVSFAKFANIHHQIRKKLHSHYLEWEKIRKNTNISQRGKTLWLW
jgi:hypothetical protein